VRSRLAETLEPHASTVLILNSKQGTRRVR
jgi:hypothetical protein